MASMVFIWMKRKNNFALTQPSALMWIINRRWISCRNQLKRRFLITQFPSPVTLIRQIEKDPRRAGEGQMNGSVLRSSLGMFVFRLFQWHRLGSCSSLPGHGRVPLPGRQCQLRLRHPDHSERILRGRCLRKGRSRCMFH